MNTHVDFEIAKMLQEKRFDEKCSHYYVLDFQNFKATGILKKAGTPDDNPNSDLLYFVGRKGQPHLANAPTIAQVVMWFLKKHKLWISVTGETTGEHWFPVVDIVSEKGWENSQLRIGVNTLNRELKKKWYNSPDEAYKAGINGISKHLI